MRFMCEFTHKAIEVVTSPTAKGVNVEKHYETP
jgi:hypothetical protein